MTNPLVAAFPGIVQPYATVKTALAGALALPLKDAAAVAAFNTLDLAADATPYPAVIYAGAVYDYAAGDFTTAHDPDAGCITDASGRRYLRVAALKPNWIVLDKDLTAPPGSPAEGDSYYVATAATGAWAGHDGDYALYSARGWTFRAIDEGHILYVADEERFYYMPASGTLTAGLGDLALGNASVEARHLAAPFGYVVQAAQTTPPGSPSDRVAYIVTATATGAWAGQENKIAEYDADAAAWLFLTPRSGDHVWDVGAGYIKYYTGSAWARAVPDPGYRHVRNLRFRGSPGEIVVSLGTTPQAFDTVPIQTDAGRSIVIEISRLKFYAEAGTSTPPTLTFTLLRDTEATPLLTLTYASGTSWKFSDGGHSGTYLDGKQIIRLVETAADGASHDYKFRLAVNVSLTTINVDCDIIIYTLPAAVTS